MSGLLLVDLAGLVADRCRTSRACAWALSEWKLSPAAKLCVNEARLGGKSVHVAG